MSSQGRCKLMYMATSTRLPTSQIEDMSSCLSYLLHKATRKICLEAVQVFLEMHGVDES